MTAHLTDRRRIEVALPAVLLQRVARVYSQARLCLGRCLSVSLLGLTHCVRTLRNLGQGEQISKHQLCELVQLFCLRFRKFVMGGVVAFEPDVVGPCGQVLGKGPVLRKCFNSFHKSPFALGKLFTKPNFQRLSEHHAGCIVVLAKAIHSLLEIAFNIAWEVIRVFALDLWVEVSNRPVSCRCDHSLVATGADQKGCRTILVQYVRSASGKAPLEGDRISRVVMLPFEGERRVANAAVRAIEFDGWGQLHADYPGDNELRHSDLGFCCAQPLREVVA